MELIEIVATTKLKLKPLALPFAYSFTWKEKRGENIAWFTPSGKAKIWFGGLQTKAIGNITPEEEKALHKEMKTVKADILFDGHNQQKLYTTCGNITELPDASQILVKLIEEWDSRHEWEEWECL